MTSPTLTLEEIRQHYSLPSTARIAALDEKQLYQLVKYVFEHAGYDVQQSAGLNGADMRIHPLAHSQQTPIALVQISTKHVSKASVASLKEALGYAPGAIGYLITSAGFAQPAQELASSDQTITLIDGDHFRRYIRYVAASRLHPSRASAIAPDHILRADAVRRLPMSQTRVLTLANNKGGVGKTTTALNMAFGLARPDKPELGKRVMLIDTDAQANLTRSLLGSAGMRSGLTLTDYFIEPENSGSNASLGQLVRPTQFQNVWLIPAQHTLSLAHADVSTWPDVELQFVADLHSGQVCIPNSTQPFDWIIIDTPPAMSLHTRAALASAHYVLAPVGPSAFADPGLNNLFDSIEAMHALMGSEVRMLGCVATQMEDKSSQEKTLRELDKNLLKPKGIRPFGTRIPHDLEVEKAYMELGRGQRRSIFSMSSKGAAAAYEKLLKEVLSYVDNA